MDKLFDFIEHCVKTLLLSSAFTLLVIFVISSLFWVLDIIIDRNAMDYFAIFVFVCMTLISNEFVKDFKK